MNIKKIILQQKTETRKGISNLQRKCNLNEESHLRIAYAKKFLRYNFSSVVTPDDLFRVIHKFKHLNSTIDYSKCLLCKKIADEVMLESLHNTKEMDLLPRFGNLIEVLAEEANEERSVVEHRRVPSQNDLTRWALKDAVLSYYQGLNMADDIPVVINRFDDRLITELAPDFDVIAKIWLEKLDELKRRDDKYTLILDEYDKAEADLQDGMRGSAFEKQLDRYREEFMQKLVR